MIDLEKLKKFIIDNNLKFEDSGSGLNSDCTILAGYACYLGFSKEDTDTLSTLMPTLHAEKEFKKVFKYAFDNDYGKFWETEVAKKMYKF